MAYKTNLAIVLILIVSFIANLFNIYGWFHGHSSGTAELMSSTYVVLLWFIVSLYMGYKYDGLFFMFSLVYWGLAIIISGVSYLLHLSQNDYAITLSVIVCFMYTGQLYGIGSNLTPNIHFNPSLAITLILGVFVISLIGFSIGAVIKKKLPLKEV